MRGKLVNNFNLFVRVIYLWNYIKFVKLEKFSVLLSIRHMELKIRNPNCTKNYYKNLTKTVFN